MGSSTGNKTRVVNINSQPSFDVYIGRGSVWGNPFRIGADGSRAVVIQKYASWLLEHQWIVEKARRELRGKTLGCHCKPLPCHGDALALVADSDGPGAVSAPTAVYNGSVAAVFCGPGCRERWIHRRHLIYGAVHGQDSAPLPPLDDGLASLALLRLRCDECGEPIYSGALLGGAARCSTGNAGG